MTKLGAREITQLIEKLCPVTSRSDSPPGPQAQSQLNTAEYDLLKKLKKKTESVEVVSLSSLPVSNAEHSLQQRML